MSTKFSYCPEPYVINFPPNELAPNQKIGHGFHKENENCLLISFIWGNCFLISFYEIHKKLDSRFKNKETKKGMDF